MKLNDEEIIQTVLANVKNRYEKEQQLLSTIGLNHKTEGEIRYAAGELVERILQTIFDTINSFLPADKIVSKVGRSDFLTKTIEYKGNTYTNKSIQVDRHIWFKDTRIAFIENKTYLDSCYYDRALADFKKIVQSLVQHNHDPRKCLFIVFAGQKAGKDNTFLTYEAEFWHETKSILHSNEGIEPKTFFFLKGIRSSGKPLYKVKHEINDDALVAFTKLILSAL